MEDANTPPAESKEIQPKPGMGPIDVASQHVKGSMEWLVELLGKGDEISPEMRMILSEQTQELLALLQARSEAFSSNLFKELKAKVESGEIPKYRGKCNDGSAIDFVHCYYGNYLDQKLLTQNFLRLLDEKLIKAITYECSKKGGKTSLIIPPAREV